MYITAEDSRCLRLGLARRRPLLSLPGMFVLWRGKNLPDFRGRFSFVPTVVVAEVGKQACRRPARDPLRRGLICSVAKRERNE